MLPKDLGLEDSILLNNLFKGDFYRIQMMMVILKSARKRIANGDIK